MKIARYFVFLTLATTILSQSLNEDRRKVMRPASVRLPDGKNAWAIRVVSVGGITGRSLLDIMVTSKGEVSCTLDLEFRKSCPPNLSITSQEYQAIAELATRPMPDSTSRVSASCFDCFLTSATLHHRDARGKVQKYFAYWQVDTISQVAPDLVQLAGRVRSLGR